MLNNQETEEMIATGTEIAASVPAQNEPEMDPDEVLLRKMYKKLEKKIIDTAPNMDLNRIRSAFEMAFESHKGQKRKDGSPYATHVLAAAEIIVEMGLDEDSVVSAILHDVIEDCPVTYEDISKKFGPDVADIVDGVTKLTRVNFADKEDEQMENMRKMLMAMCKDIRVILIKLADRLHNMRTMDYQTPAKQRIKSLETMQIYAPIAHRLGMQAIKWELEDLSLLYLDPVGCKAITDVVETRRPELEAFMANMKDKIQRKLEAAGIDCSISYRIKHIYSIYRKMYAQKLDLDSILDLCALRVITDKYENLYEILGQVHAMFNLVPGRFKDYVSMPKPNGYQSLHTTVVGKEGIRFEVQIRTWDMHRAAEYGIAAHWKYKSGESGVKVGDEEKFAWVRQVLENQQNSDAEDFFSGLRIDMFSDECFVFSPKGDVVNLPAGATPIDFAYEIHSAIGNSMIGAKVNGKLVQISHQLQNGDIVEILTAKNAPGPSRDWLNIARSSSARTKIRQWFKRERKAENIELGKDMFEAELKRNGVSLADALDSEALTELLKKNSLKTPEDLYATIGYGGTTATKAVHKIAEEVLKKKTQTTKTAVDKLNDAAEKRNKQPSKNVINGVLVEGIDNCLVKFARCCTPVPGDDIVGFVTRGLGVSVHRTDCRNHINSRINPEGDGRWIDVSWYGAHPDIYISSVKIDAFDRGGLVMDVATVLTSLNAKVRSLNARDIGNGNASISITLDVKDLDELKTIITRLSGVKGVTSVTRAAT